MIGNTGKLFGRKPLRGNLSLGGCFQWEWLGARKRDYDPVRIRHRLELMSCGNSESTGLECRASGLHGWRDVRPPIGSFSGSVYLPMAVKPALKTIPAR